jgi:hypothetical protein
MLFSPCPGIDTRAREMQCPHVQHKQPRLKTCWHPKKFESAVLTYPVCRSGRSGAKPSLNRCLHRTGNDSQISHHIISAAQAAHKAFDHELHWADDLIGRNALASGSPIETRQKTTRG